VLDLLSRANYPVGSLRSKSWTEFGAAEAPNLDFVITVCDRTAREPSPNWRGEPLVVHWGVPDPAEFEGTDAEKRLFAADVFRMLHSRIRRFLSLPIESLERRSLQRELDEIGSLQDFSPT
jgi:protein-tyrosine-phosphatase